MYQVGGSMRTESIDAASATIHLADCREVMRAMSDNSISMICTDPPYEIGFMGHGWDGSGIAFDREVWTEALRILKPGGHVVAFGAARTYHWLACAVELAGFEIRDMVPWLQGQGMPHGDDISKRIDKMAGAEREVVGQRKQRANLASATAMNNSAAPVELITAPATPEAAQWSGWNTQLAPGHEPAVLARKPLSEPTVAANVLRWGTGALNVDACRLATDAPIASHHGSARKGAVANVMHGNDVYQKGDAGKHYQTLGRWPPNVTLSEAAAGRLDAMVGKRKSGALRASTPQGSTGTRAFGERRQTLGKRDIHAREQGPSEFFYTAKAATREREQGCEHLRWARSGEGFVPWEPGLELLVDRKGKPIGNPHPTVKPLALLRWLLRLGMPPGGVAFDPFMGSGTTGVAAHAERFAFIGSDMTPWAFDIAHSRIAWASSNARPVLHEAENVPLGGLFASLKD